MSIASSKLTPRRPASLREHKKQQTRDALVDTALRLFQENGFTETTLDEVCATVEVSKRTFFRNFASKEDVVLASSHELWLAYQREVECLTPGSGTVFATLQKALLTALDTMTTTRWAERTAASWQLAETSPSITAHGLSFCSRISNETWRTLCTRLDLTDPEDLRPRLAQDLLVASFHSAVERWATQPGPKALPGLRSRLQDTLAAASQATTYTGAPHSTTNNGSV